MMRNTDTVMSGDISYLFDILVFLGHFTSCGARHIVKLTHARVREYEWAFHIGARLMRRDEMALARDEGRTTN